MICLGFCADLHSILGEVCSLRSFYVIFSNNANNFPHTHITKHTQSVFGWIQSGILLVYETRDLIYVVNLIGQNFW